MSTQKGPTADDWNKALESGVFDAMNLFFVAPTGTKTCNAYGRYDGGEMSGAYPLKKDTIGKFLDTPDGLVVSLNLSGLMQSALKGSGLPQFPAGALVYLRFADIRISTAL